MAHHWQQQDLDPESLRVQGEIVRRAVEERVVAYRRSKIKVAPSAANTRASSIGHPCDRFLYYERTSNEQRAPEDERLRAIYDVGDATEAWVLRLLEDAGIRVVQRGRDFLDRLLQLSGHVDARLAIPEVGEVQAEVKSMAPWLFDQVETVADLLGSKKPWLRRYPAQLQAYLYLSAEPLGLFILVNKSTGALRVLPMPIDLGYCEELVRKAERVRDAVTAGVPPPQIQDRETCASCPFLAPCGPDLLAGEGLVFLAEEVAELLEAREVLKPAKDEWDDVEEALKAAVAKAGEYVAGQWVISAKDTPRRAYAVKETSYLRRVYKRLPEIGRKP